MKNRISRSLSAMLAVCTLAALPAVGQVYQRADTIPVVPGGGVNPPTNLQAVAAHADGGYIAVGREGMFNIHLARYDAAGTVVWSRYIPMPVDAQATSINQLAGGALPTYVVAGEIADALPWGRWSMVIDDTGVLVCPPRELNGVGPAAPLSRSPVAAKPLMDASYVVTGRARLAAGGLILGCLTRNAPGCGPVMWSRVYTIVGGTMGLTGANEITDVVEETDTLLAVGTADLVGGGAVPFLLRVVKATGVPVAINIYAPGDPAMIIRGDGLAQSYNPAGVLDGYVFDGRSTPLVAGGAAVTSNYVVKVAPPLFVLWAETFPEFEPCHACVRQFRNTTLLAGTRNFPAMPAANIWGELIDSGGGLPIWGWLYGHGVERGNGVAITMAAPGSPMGPIIVGLGGAAAAAPGGYLVKSFIGTGSSGGCEIPAPAPFPGGGYWPAQCNSTLVQYRFIQFPLLIEELRTVDACPPRVCCNVDFNNDGDLGTDADIEAFFACLGGSCCPTCPPDADFNCDGDMGTDADIESFFSVLAGGPC